MRIMVASDIHGDYAWAVRVVDKFKESGADKLLLLGDILYHGPRNDLPANYEPKKVITLLNDMSDKILCVRGNCDTEVDQMVLNFPILADYIYLVSGETVIFATHGHVYNPDNPPKALPEGGILLTGHTHVACDRDMGDYRYINPGSPSIPKEGTLPSYIMIEDGKVELIPFDT